MHVNRIDQQTKSELNDGYDKQDPESSPDTFGTGRGLMMIRYFPGCCMMLFVWFIGAFLWDGSSFLDLRNTYDPHYKEQTTKEAPKEKPHDGQKPGHLE